MDLVVPTTQHGTAPVPLVILSFENSYSAHHHSSRDKLQWFLSSVCEFLQCSHGTLPSTHWSLLPASPDPLRTRLPSYQCISHKAGTQMLRKLVFYNWVLAGVLHSYTHCMCVCVCIFISMYTYRYIDTYMCIYIAHIYIGCVSLYMHKGMYTHMIYSAYIHVHVYTYTYT